MNNGGLTNPVDGSLCVWFWGRSGIVTDDGSRREFTQRATDATRVVPSALTFSLRTPAPTSARKKTSHHYHKCQPSCQNTHTGTGVRYWLPLCLSQVALHSLFHPTTACREIKITPQHNSLLAWRLCRWMGGVTWMKKSIVLGIDSFGSGKDDQSINFWVFCWYKLDFDLMQKSQVKTLSEQRQCWQHTTQCEKCTVTSWTWTSWSSTQLSSSAKCRILQAALFSLR